MQRILMFAALALCQWAPWILATLLPGPVAAVAGALLFTALVAWAVRRTRAADRPRWGLSTRRPAGGLLLAGLATGAVVYLAVFGVRWIAGGGTVTVQIDATDAVLVVVSGLAVAAYQATSEELVFRGAVFTLLVPARSAWMGVVLSTGLFVLFHAPRGEALVTGPYALHLVLAGVAFALAYVRTGTIWLGLGLHTGWNVGAYLLKEGDPALVRLTADLPTGWGGWSDWVSVGGNAVLLLATLVLTRGRPASAVELSPRMPQRS